MAYLNFLASVPVGHLLAYQADRSSSLKASKVIGVSHLLTSWIQLQPLGNTLAAAIDGGDELSAQLWHPLRPPIVHSVEAVKTLTANIESAWQQASESVDILEDEEFFRPQIEERIALFRHACEHEEAIVSVLERPADFERSQKVELPDFGISQSRA